MPLRDHFHAPLHPRRHWEGFHYSWTGSIIRQLLPRLPSRYFAEPHTHLGFQVEADVATFKEEDSVLVEESPGNGVALAVWAPPRPAQTHAVDIPAQDEFEVRVYDEMNQTQLVAVVELVSPANKDRAEHRRAFVCKCANYLQQQVSLTVVDIVTARHPNLHNELMELLQISAPPPWPEETDLYAVAYRTTKLNGKWQFDIWAEPLAVGAALPTLPLWLASDLALPLELEESYEETCRMLRIP